MGNNDWEGFAQGADAEEYTSFVLARVQFCTEAVLTAKTLKVFPNQKPWLVTDVRSLFRAQDGVFRTGNMLAYRTVGRHKKKAFEYRCKHHTEDNSQIDYKERLSLTSHHRAFHHTLNQFFTSFNTQDRRI